MPTWLTILLWILAAGSLGLLVYWCVVAFHVLRTMASIPTARQALSLPAPERWPSVCVIMPAHNEERGIALAVESLKRQDYPDFRVVFALDRCTDRTSEIVRDGVGDDPRFEIVEVESCPEDWVGKVHAIWTAHTRSAAARSSELLLFLDADTIMEPECVRAGVTLLVHRGLQMLSLMSTLTADEWFERVVQPAAGMELLRQYPLARANSDTRRRPFANGQFILITAPAYESVGGHAAVKSEVLEDVYFARHVAAKGHPLGLFFADRLLVCRMYSTWEAFQRGWIRIYGESANRKPHRLCEAAWRLRLTGTILPLIGIAATVGGGVAWAVFGGSLAGATTLIAAAGVLIFMTVIAYVYAFGRTPVRFAPTYIIGAWLAAGIMLRAAANLKQGTPTAWGGKEYARSVR